MLNKKELEKVYKELKARFEDEEIACIIYNSNIIYYKDKIEYLKRLLDTEDESLQIDILHILECQDYFDKVLNNFKKQKDIIYSIYSSKSGTPFFDNYQDAIKYAQLYFPLFGCPYTIVMNRVKQHSKNKTSNTAKMDVSDRTESNLRKFEWQPKNWNLRNIDKNFLTEYIYDTVNDDIAFANFTPDGKLIKIDTMWADYTEDRPDRALKHPDVFYIRNSVVRDEIIEEILDK